MTHLLDRTRRTYRAGVVASAGSARALGTAPSTKSVGLGAIAGSGLHGQALNPSWFMAQP
jgi:hypothetical protein